MTHPIAVLAGRHLDLEAAPFTLPGSRLLVFRGAEGVRVHTSEYERTLAECRVLDALTVRDAEGAPLPVTSALPHAVSFGGGAATLCFDGPGVLSVGSTAADLAVHWETREGSRGSLPLDTGGAGVRIVVAADRTVRVAAGGSHPHAIADAEEVWDAWFARCPEVRDDLREMTAFCWWVLGANIVHLPGLGDARAVVPSKIGYVGLWQWDAYFIAVGLRHGDPALAREQLELALRFPTAAGQLPDVVHEHGVLASSDDLPPADRENLRRAGSAVADPAAPVPLTKPPLAAWALGKLLEGEPVGSAVEAWARAQLAIIERSQDWWFTASDLDHDGLPEYGHPYSSGLDDSPVFDGPLPTTSPDLAAYLVVQDRAIAAIAGRLGAGQRPRNLARAEATMGRLLELWDADRGLFRARAAGGWVGADTIVGLLPLLTGTLPPEVLGALEGALDDPARFALPWGVPTVAASDPDFSAQRMWRGPSWVNTNALVVEGLRASGREQRARELAERTVALVIHGGGPHEYFDPITGERARTATTAFGWSAALFVDLAVWLSRS